MEWHGKAWIQGLLEHGKEICSNFKSNKVINIKSNRKSRNKSEKFSKKESSEIRDVTRGSDNGCRDDSVTSEPHQLRVRKVEADFVAAATTNAEMSPRHQILTSYLRV